MVIDPTFVRTPSLRHVNTRQSSPEYPDDIQNLGIRTNLSTVVENGDLALYLAKCSNFRPGFPHVRVCFREKKRGVN